MGGRIGVPSGQPLDFSAPNFALSPKGTTGLGLSPTRQGSPHLGNERSDLRAGLPFRSRADGELEKALTQSASGGLFGAEGPSV